MSLFLKQFSTHSEYEAYIASEDKVLPNVSICTTEGDVHYNPLVKVTSVSLDKNVLSLSEGDSETLIATVLPANASNKDVTWNSNNESVATVTSGGVITAVATGSCTITVTTEDGGLTAQCSISIIDPYAGHEYVDLGLPSGTKWATMNVGAASETDYGNYYMYGKGADQYAATSGQSGYSGTENPLAESADTAAQVWGGQWHMPTSAQCQELIDNTTYQWTTINGIAVAKFTATNGNYVLFPAAGYAYNGSVTGVGSGGFYCGSTPKSGGLKYQISFSSTPGSLPSVNKSGLTMGSSVRPVVG